jgi:hypothetical protein
MIITSNGGLLNHLGIFSIKISLLGLKHFNINQINRWEGILMSEKENKLPICHKKSNF